MRRDEGNRDFYVNNLVSTANSENLVVLPAYCSCVSGAQHKSIDNPGVLKLQDRCGTKF